MCGFHCTETHTRTYRKKEGDTIVTKSYRKSTHFQHSWSSRPICVCVCCDFGHISSMLPYIFFILLPAASTLFDFKKNMNKNTHTHKAQLSHTTKSSIGIDKVWNVHAFNTFSVSCYLCDVQRKRNAMHRSFDLAQHRDLAPCDNVWLAIDFDIKYNYPYISVCCVLCAVKIMLHDCNWLQYWYGHILDCIYCDCVRRNSDTECHYSYFNAM